MTDLGRWVTKDSPRGEHMPIDCTYTFSRGRAMPDFTDLPPGWKIVGVTAMNDEVQHFPTMGEHAVQGVYHAFLAQPDGTLVAVWDEGRWWTPDESAAWLLMLQAPATYAFAEGLRQQQMPRWWRRAQRSKRRRR